MEKCDQLDWNWNGHNIHVTRSNRKQTVALLCREIVQIEASQVSADNELSPFISFHLIAAAAAAATNKAKSLVELSTSIKTPIQCD